MATGDLEKIKTLFPYIGKKPPRIGREVVNAFEWSGSVHFYIYKLSENGLY